MQRLGLDVSKYRRHDARGDITALADSVKIMWQRLGLDPQCSAISQARDSVAGSLEPVSGLGAGLRQSFGCGQGDEFRASPQRAVRNESTQATEQEHPPPRRFSRKDAR